MLSCFLVHLELKWQIRLYTPVVPLKTIPGSRPKCAKSILFFSWDWNGPITLSFEAVHIYMASKREYHPRGFLPLDFFQLQNITRKLWLPALLELPPLISLLQPILLGSLPPPPPTHIPPAAYPSGLPNPPPSISLLLPILLGSLTPPPISLLLPIPLGSLTPVLSRLWMLSRKVSQRFYSALNVSIQF